MLAKPRAPPTPTNTLPSHKDYHGKTGVVYNVTKSAVGVIIYKQVGNRYIEKRVNLRVEHVRLSRSREEFIVRVKTNAEKKRKAKEEGTTVFLTTQYLEEADQLADRVGIISKGVIVAEGTPAELKAEVGTGAEKKELET